MIVNRWIEMPNPAANVPPAVTTTGPAFAGSTIVDPAPAPISVSDFGITRFVASPPQSQGFASTHVPAPIEIVSPFDAGETAPLIVVNMQPLGQTVRVAARAALPEPANATDRPLGVDRRLGLGDARSLGRVAGRACR